MFTYLGNKFRRITSNGVYMAEIDGMRFLSLTLVTLFHIHGYFMEKTKIVFADNPDNYYWFNRFMAGADRSVPLFFAISGFILCLPFANHYIKGGRKIELKNYFVRRVTRLEPPYFIVMTIIFLAQIAMHVYTFKALFPSLLASLIYSHNLIFHATPLVTVVAWTLEVEIQYYIIAPFMFRILKLSAVTRRLLISGAIIGFILLQNIYPPTFLSIYGNIQHFLIGMLIADFYVCGIAKDFFAQKWMALTGIAVFLFMFLMPMGHMAGFENIQYKILLPFLIGLFYYIILNNAIVKSVFSFKFVPIIGGMCYTIYLLHYTIISMLGRFTAKIKFTDYFFPNLLFQFTVLMFAILAISSVFYLYIERPFMDKKWVTKLMGKKATEGKAE
ncbi:hypothetical protein CJD36_008020 [Flavipsychrobacter stenotrophus]|uniref:Acyltransferase 3 domain-containing protein n=1 Tax=Flavipsychrobacter stenotrophus TaxID=2077091 RepID=A0A2S7SXS6_9BACT|nr:acyltransferase [Flavipsychrobacter stenotrophus]PQJ11732.1 hypothetical protein CJD36_008020 [Flavipsychrobacter stenotrophus]